MAVAILLATELVPAPAEPLLFLGELSLDGALRHTQGILPMVSLARDQRLSSVVVPAINPGEAALIGPTSCSRAGRGLLTNEDAARLAIG